MNRLSSIDKLRAIAASLVLYFHTTNTVNNYPTELFLRNSGKYGHHGVEIFFVISGFIILYSMWMAGFVFRTDIGKFIAKRLLRVEPPYIASIIFTIAIGLIANAAYGKNLYVYTLPQVASHLFYLTGFLGYEWVNPVYWTLAIEFQFYIFLALLYPLVINPSDRIFLFVIIAWLFFASGEWANGTLIAYLPLFAMGMVSALGKMGSVSLQSAYVLLALFFLGGAWKLGYIVAVLGGLTAFILLTGTRIPHLPGLQLFGLISYSVYLFHYPIVEKLIRFSKVFGYNIFTQVSAVIFAMLFASLVSWMAYILLERPSILMAGRIKYSK